MEKHMHGSSSMEIDYRDVFGGPPRFVALLSASRSGSSSSAMLDKVTARASSFRSSVLPVFDLPVYGDESSAGRVYYDSRANSNVYNNMFDEEGPFPENVLVSNVYVGSRSKASSRSSSRRMSPVHPASASAGQSGGDDRLVAKTRPAVGRLSKRGSLSSTSSFDESGGKYADALLFGTTNDSFLSSVPSSPPRSGSFGRLKSLTGPTDDINVGAPQSVSDADDVYGEYPQTNFTHQFSAVPPNSMTMTNTSGSHGVKALAVEKPGLKIFSMSDNLETSDTIQAGFSRSSSIKDVREKRDQQVWMARRTDSSVSERSELAAGKTSFTARDASFSRESSFDNMHSLGAPTTLLKFKSWKDLVTDSPTVRTPISKLVPGSVPVVWTGLSGMPMKEAVIINDAEDGLVGKLLDMETEQDTGKISYPSMSSLRGKVKSAEYLPDMDMEERELQALLMNAWKVNEEMEREKYSAKFPVEVAKHLNRQINSLHAEQNERLDVDERDSDINWKEWRKFGRGERLQVSSNTSSIEESPVGLQMRADEHAATSQDTAEVVRGDTEAPKIIVLPDGLTGLDSKKTSGKGGIGAQKNGEYLVKGQTQGRSDDLHMDSSFPNLMRTLSQDILNSGDLNRSSVTAQLEETECLVVGFEEVEGESSERRQLRWERHVRARRRAEKALEELQERDAELQRQEKEKQQFSDTSDEKIRRWAAGKEGNLRALLSNLQHVLWSESGWQPIPLSGLIEVPDVRKAYRKAILFVHPDKMQQKGATLHHKYIAERVFDILQEAWKRFNLQESL